jgi:hypothetical protein
MSASDAKRKFLCVCEPAAIRGKAEIPDLPASHMTTRSRKLGHERPTVKIEGEDGSGKTRLSPSAGAPHSPGSDTTAFVDDVNRALSGSTGAMLPDRAC